MFTGDVNILKVTMAVQYQLSDPAQYLFGAADPDELVADAVQAVLIEELAGVPVDEALTIAKAELQTTTRARAQRLLDRYGCGIRLVATNLESIEPPWAILAAFQDVVSAKKDGEKSVDQAVTEANRILPRARGEAATAREEAEAYRHERVTRARGQAARFLSVMTEYRKDPEVFRQRLLLQTLETVVPRIRTYVLDSQPGDPPTSLRIIE
jgi:membrane protease subunit HflK